VSDDVPVEVVDNRKAMRRYRHGHLHLSIDIGRCGRNFRVVRGEYLRIVKKVKSE
jgi:hypothetical protein